jgi:Ca2+-binding EF-hand superfamily protein
MPLTTEQKEEFKKIFDAVDSNGNGTVDASELKNLIRACIEEEPDDAVMAEVMKQVDKDGSGTMDFAEFCQMLEPFIK